MTLNSTAGRRLSPHTRRLLRYAVASRLLLLALIITWRSLLSPYDTSASINPPCLSATNSSSPPPSLLLPRLGSAIERSIVWDGVYFTRIAECGYEYEQTYAFLPLLPFCVSILSKSVFAPLVPLIGYRAVLGVSGYVINNIAFVMATLYLYWLSVIVSKDKEVALRASILFCFNPASIFYSSIYSESLYALLSFGGLYHFMNGKSNFATLCLALSGCARSNGVLNAGYICYHAMQRLKEAFSSRDRSYLLMVKILLAGVLRSMFIFAPFVAFQAYGYLNICMGHFVAEMRPWCKARLPLLYNYIQSHYWYVTHIIHSITLCFCCICWYYCYIISTWCSRGGCLFGDNIKRFWLLGSQENCFTKKNIIVLFYIPSCIPVVLISEPDRSPCMHEPLLRSKDLCGRVVSELVPHIRGL